MLPLLWEKVKVAFIICFHIKDITISYHTHKKKRWKNLSGTDSSFSENTSYAFFCILSSDLTIPV